MFGYDHMFGGWMIVIWIAVIIVIIVAIKMLLDQSSARKNSDRESPLDVLKKQYASGNITEEEYQRKKKELLS